MQPVPDDIYDFKELENITNELENPDKKVNDRL